MGPNPHFIPGFTLFGFKLSCGPPSILMRYVSRIAAAQLAFSAWFCSADGTEDCENFPCTKDATHIDAILPDEKH
jgi:hypothetical protein